MQLKLPGLTLQEHRANSLHCSLRLDITELLSNKTSDTKSQLNNELHIARNGQLGLFK